MKGEFDQTKETADEQARSIEELKSLLASSRASTDDTPQVNFDGNIISGNGEASQRTMSLNMFGRLSGNAVQVSQRRMGLNMFDRLSKSLLVSQKNMSLDWDTFSLMMITPVLSSSWILGFVSLPLR